MMAALQNAIVAPGPSAAQIEFFFAAGRGFGIVKIRRIEDHAQFPQQFVEDVVAVGEAGEIDAVSVDVQHGRFFGRDEKPPKIAQGGRAAPKELDHIMRIVQRTRVDNHRGETLLHAKS